MPLRVGLTPGTYRVLDSPTAKRPQRPILRFSLFFRMLCICGLLCVLPAHALTVEIEAPDEIKTLLTQHLEAARAARLGEVVVETELARLRERSLESARELLATEGYFSPRVESALTYDAAGPLMRFSVMPGARTQVRDVQLVFVGALAVAGEAGGRLRARSERQFTLRPGMPFRQSDWDAAKQAALQVLLSSQYSAARMVASEARIDPDTQSADLSVTLDSGPAFYYGELQIEGAQRYPQSIIRKLDPTRPGQPYRQQTLLDFQVMLEESGYYSRASVRVEPDPARAAAAPIRVQVEERPQKLFSVGIGASTDTGARVQASWLHRNIQNRGLRLKLDAQLEEARQNGEVELAWPRNRDGYDNSLGLQLKQEDIEGQETRVKLAVVKRSRIRGRLSNQIEVTQSLQYQTEKLRVGAVPQLDSRALTANLAWTRRRLGRGFYPRSGDVLSAQIGGASEALLSDTSFLRLQGRYTRYYSVGDNGRLILRGELGGVLAENRDAIPSDFLFRAGGDNSVRGYAYQSLGRDLSGGVASVRYLVTGSAEYNYFFSNNWGWAVFVDAGDAADSTTSLKPVFGYGIGARYRSPVGPINLDLAYGEATEQVRLHFSLGVSF